MPKKPSADAEQLKRFKETAKELGADKSEVAFEKAMETIAKHHPDTPNESIRKKRK